MFTTSLESFFYKPYIVAGVTQRDLVVLQRDVIWRADDLNEYLVPAGFVLNLASVPWGVGWAIIKLGRHQRASCLHDWFYANQVNSKSWADLQFRLAMEIDSVRGWRKWMAWSGVAVGGWLAWWTKDDILISPVKPDEKQTNEVSDA